MTVTCREGHNSVVTSMAWFLTRDNDSKRDDEALVKRTFHDLRRRYLHEWEQSQGAADVAGATPMARSSARRASIGDIPKANVTEVTEWLEDQKSRVRHDPRIKERLRPTWERKLDDAVAATRAGEGPDIATFRAWTTLEDEVREAKGPDAPASAPPLTREQYRQTLDRARDIRRQYEMLLARRGTVNMAEDPDSEAGRLLARWEVDAALIDANGGDSTIVQIEALRTCQTNALDSLRRRVGDDAENHRVAREVNRKFVQTLANHPSMQHLQSRVRLSDSDLSMWSELEDGPVATAHEQRMALEYLAQARDRNAVATGMVPPQEGRRRALERQRLRAQLPKPR